MEISYFNKNHLDIDGMTKNCLQFARDKFSINLFLTYCRNLLPCFPATHVPEYWRVLK